MNSLTRCPRCGTRRLKELASRTQQNLGAMIQTGIKLADGFQAIMREWAAYTRDAMQCNIDGMNRIMRARTPQDLRTAQRELMNAEVQVMLNSGVRISEATLRVASDAVQSIGGRTTQETEEPRALFRSLKYTKKSRGSRGSFHICSRSTQVPDAASVRQRWRRGRRP